MRKLFSIAPLFLTFLAVGCGSGNAIQVGDVAVSKDSFNRWVQTNAHSISGDSSKSGELDAPDFESCIAAKKKASIPQPPNQDALKKLCQAAYTAAQQLTVKTLASQAWVLAQAQKQGLTADARQVDQQLKTLQQQYPVQSSGANTDDLRSHAKYIVLLQQLRQKAERIKPANPTKQQLLAYYNKHVMQFSKMPSRDIMLLVAKSKQQADSAASALREGKSWDSAFKSYNNLSAWGSSRPLQAGATQPSFQPGLRKLLFGTSSSKILGPYQLPEYQNGWVVFQVKKISPGYPAKPFAQIQGSIRQNFIFADRAKASDQAINKLQLEWQPRTECDEALKEMYPCQGTKQS